jgi:hypothetical protein
VSETVTYKDTVSKCDSELDTYYAEKDKIEKRLLSLLKRNKVLGRFLFLKAVAFWPMEITEEVIKGLQPKRGPKPKLENSVKLIMKLLTCSHRTALDYKATLDIEQQIEKLLWLSMAAAAEKRSQHGVLNE